MMPPSSGGIVANRKDHRRRRKNGSKKFSRGHRLLQFSAVPLVAHLIWPLLLFSSCNAQFGEIASVITSLLANGGGAGLAGLGSAAGTGALGAASAGAGTAGAIGNIGQLYQLAQAALQLTGTGVGIANQASESAWFPVVVESAAKMNKDFQDRLLNGGLGGPGTKGGSAKGLGGGGTGIGKEYGKEFGSGEEAGGDGGTDGIGGGQNSLLGRLPSGPDPSSSSIFSSRVSLLPDLFSFTPAPPPGLGRIGFGGRLLPGESGSGSNGGEVSRGFGRELGGIKQTGTDGTIASRKKLIGIGTIEEVPLSPTIEQIGQGGSQLPTAAESGESTPLGSSFSLLPGEGGGQIPPERPPIPPSIPPQLPISSPKITIKLPESVENGDGRGGEELVNSAETKKKLETTIEQIETEFSTDNQQSKEGEEEKETKEVAGGTEEEAERGLEPLIPLSPNNDRLESLKMTHIEQPSNEHENGQHMVPELKKLIGQLQMGNLTSEELNELEKQLAGNEGAGVPRENTKRPTTNGGDNSAEERKAIGSGQEEQDENGQKEGGGEGTRTRGNRHRAKTGPINENRERASNRNLAALRRGLHSSEWAGGDLDAAASAQLDDAPAGKELRKSEEAEEGEKEADEEEEFIDGKKDPILRKIVDFNRPPVILSLERPKGGSGHQNGGSLVHSPTLIRSRNAHQSHRIDSEGDLVENVGSQRPAVHAAKAFTGDAILEKKKTESQQNEEAKTTTTFKNAIELEKTKATESANANVAADDDAEEPTNSGSSTIISMTSTSSSTTRQITTPTSTTTETETTTNSPIPTQTASTTTTNGIIKDSGSSRSLPLAPSVIIPTKIRAKVPAISSPPNSVQKTQTQRSKTNQQQKPREQLDEQKRRQKPLANSQMKLLVDSEVEGHVKSKGRVGGIREIGGGGLAIIGPRDPTNGGRPRQRGSAQKHVQKTHGNRLQQQLQNGQRQQQPQQGHSNNQENGRNHEQQQQLHIPASLPNQQQQENWGAGGREGAQWEQQNINNYNNNQFNRQQPNQGNSRDHFIWQQNQNNNNNNNQWTHGSWPNQQQGYNGQSATYYGQQPNTGAQSPQYGQWNNQQPTGPIQSNGQQQQQQFWPDSQGQQQFPLRTLPDPVHTTPPSVVYHPFSYGSLLTLGQSPQTPDFFRFGRK